MKNRWVENEIKLASELHKEGKRFEEIATQLNRSTRGVKEKLQNLGMYQNKIITKEITICLNCGNEIFDLKSSKRKFCSQKCNAIYNNQKYPKKKRIRNRLYNCICCRKKLNDTQFKYCSKKCESEYQKQLIWKKIDDGETTLPSRYYKQYLIEKFEEKCMKCGWNEINPSSGKIPIQLEHKDGNAENNSLDNLELLCPNCHSLTPTYMGLNRGHGRERRRQLRQQKKLNEIKMTRCSSD